jgi:predicted metal-dependent phosphoesterase TrpH
MAIKTRLSGQGVDLHTHTQASDGLWTPESLIEIAVARNVQVISVTDHDTTQNVKLVEAQARAAGLDFVPGVEVTVDWENSIYHLLLFAFDQENAELQAMLEETQRRQWNKRQTMIDALKSRGYDLHALEQVDYPGSGLLPAFELSRALLSGGEVATLDQARAVCREVDSDGSISQPIERALKVGLAAGAIPVLAHPGRGGSELSAASDEVLEELMEMGLEGVEAYHYSHNPEMEERLVKFAQKRDLAISCGSDSHDEVRQPLPWHPELCRSLLERLNLKDSVAAA